MQNIKALAYQFLAETQIKELNIPVSSLKKELKKQSIFLLKYSEFETVKDTIPKEALPSVKRAMSKNEAISLLSDSITFILYSDDLPYGRKLQRIYHEIGHIKADHKRSGVYTFEPNEEQEREADVFSLYVTAPPCIMKEIGASSADDVSCLTGLDSAHTKSALSLIRRDKGNSALNIEKSLLHQFEHFIKANKSRKKPIKKSVAIGIVMLSICLLLLAPAYNHLNNTKPASSDETTPTETSATEDAEQTDSTVWKAKTGEIYHTNPDCYHIPRSAYTMELDDAIEAGYRECKDCQKTKD